jgi:DNA-binding response OmpR family regulator
MMMNRRISVLVVDDEPRVLRFVRAELESDGYRVLIASNGRQAIELHESERPALVILDLIMPDLDGFEVLRRIRVSARTPVIVLTARASDVDKIRGLDLGADDYLTKPFSPGELIARVKAVLRRTQAAAPTLPGDIVRVGGLRINPGGRSVERDGETLHLTAKEFDLLYFLAKSPGQVFTREQLLNNVWDFEWYGDPSTVTVHIRRLREKVEPNPVRPRYVKTVWGVGYKLEP